MSTASPRLADKGSRLHALLAVPAPVICTAKGQEVKPLKVGIYHDLKGAATSRSGLAGLLWAYTRRTSYLRALAEDGSMRFDIDGNPTEPVSDKHRKDAEARLERRLAGKRQRRARAKRDRRIGTNDGPEGSAA